MLNKSEAEARNKIRNRLQLTRLSRGNKNRKKKRIQGKETDRDRQAQLAQTSEKRSINEGEKDRVILDTANRLKSSNLQAYQ